MQIGANALASHVQPSVKHKQSRVQETVAQDLDLQTNKT